jgi:serine/threonine protein kinase/WD40 repeat protein
MPGSSADQSPVEKLIEACRRPADGEATVQAGAPVPAEAPQQTLGEYRLLREIGRGGMGVVYEAEQISLGRHVALKVLPAQALLNPTYLERFRREARAAARLHHTNIVPVFGVGECDRVHFYAMQFINGEGLDRVLRDVRQLRGRRADPGTDVAAVPSTVAAAGMAVSLVSGRFAAQTDSPQAADTSFSLQAEASTAALSAATAGGSYHRSIARLGAQVADALAYAHKQGVLHRDIKPSNLLLDAQGTVWITDFGLAKAEGADELTHTGDIVGTVRFMAPERFDGVSLPQSDLYGLGLTLYELLTLKPAFADANRARLIDRLLHEPPVPPRRHDPAIPHDLETIVLKCLAKDPAERYATAEALAEDLRRFLGDRPIKARRTPWYERTWRWCRRNPWLATVSAALFLVLAVAAVAGLVMSLRLNDALGQAQADRDKAQGAEREGKRKLLASLVAEAKAQRFSGRVGQRFGTLASIREATALAHELEMPPATFDELRNLAIAALALPDLHMIKEWDGWPEGSRGLVFDETLEQYARLDKEGNITVRRLADDAVVAPLTRVGPTVKLGGFDEGGKALILLDSADHSKKRWRFDSRDPVLLGKPAFLFAPDKWTLGTSDGKVVVSLQHKTGVLGVYEAATGKHLRDIRFGKWETGPQPVGEVLWDMHPREHRLAVSMGAWHDPERRLVRVLDLDQAKVEKVLERSFRTYTHGQLAWHPDGRTLAVAYPWDVVLWDVPSGKEVRRVTDHKGGGLAVSVSRSGQLMSTTSGWAGGVKFWHPYTGKLLLSLPNMSIHPNSEAADGRMYTYRTRGTRVQLWATEPSPALRVLVRGVARGQPNDYRRVSVHKAGRLLAAGSNDGVSLFDLANGLDVGYLDLGMNLTVQFDPATGDLLTFGEAGLWRWPVRTEGHGFLVGPPKRLVAAPGSDNEFRISRDGRLIAVSLSSRALLLHADRPGQPVDLGAVHDVRQQISISPDGRWVATGCHGAGGGVNVWETGSGRLVKSQKFPQTCAAQFSADGKWLLVGASPCRYWRVGDWKEESAPLFDRGPGGAMPEFTPDGRFLVWESGEGALQLLNTATGREVVRLESPDLGRCDHTTFSPDGRLLITRNGDYTAIHAWDLPELRRQLKTLDLDWEAPPYPAEAARPRSFPPPLQVKIDRTGLTAVTQKRRAAININNEAWLLVTGPADKRDPARALQLIEQAIRIDPDNPTFLNTLGVVQYRNAKYKEAAETLTKSLAGGAGRFDAFDLFFLAMCHARLDDKVAAKDCFDRAVRWTDGQKDLVPQHVEELRAFRAEAEGVLSGK